ncbi:MAG: hypothetical protein R3A50_00775 [Saprospiraceae bacterium]
MSKFVINYTTPELQESQAAKDPSNTVNIAIFESPFETHKQIMDAWEKWPTMSFEEKLQIIELTNQILPDSFEKSQWDEHINNMRKNIYFVPSSLTCFVSLNTEGHIWETLSRFFANQQELQGGNPTSLENLSFQGGDSEQTYLSSSLIDKVKSVRKKNN